MYRTVAHSNQVPAQLLSQISLNLPSEWTGSWVPAPHRPTFVCCGLPSFGAKRMSQWPCHLHTPHTWHTWHIPTCAVAATWPGNPATPALLSAISSREPRDSVVGESLICGLGKQVRSQAPPTKIPTNPWQIPTKLHKFRQIPTTPENASEKVKFAQRMDEVGRKESYDWLYDFLVVLFSLFMPFFKSIYRSENEFPQLLLLLLGSRKLVVSINFYAQEQ